MSIQREERYSFRQSDQVLTDDVIARYDQVVDQLFEMRTKCDRGVEPHACGRARKFPQCGDARDLDVSEIRGLFASVQGAGLDLIDPPKDGNCMFSCLSHVFFGHYRATNFMRCFAVDCYTSTSNAGYQFIKEGCGRNARKEDVEKEVNKHVSTLKEQNTWGTSTDLAAIGYKLGMQFVIFTGRMLCTEDGKLKVCVNAHAYPHDKSRARNAKFGERHLQVPLLLTRNHFYLIEGVVDGDNETKLLSASEIVRETPQRAAQHVQVSPEHNTINSTQHMWDAWNTFVGPAVGEGENCDSICDILTWKCDSKEELRWNCESTGLRFGFQSSFPISDTKSMVWACNNVCNGKKCTFQIRWHRQNNPTMRRVAEESDDDELYGPVAPFGPRKTVWYWKVNETSKTNCFKHSCFYRVFAKKNGEPIEALPLSADALLHRFGYLNVSELTLSNMKQMLSGEFFGDLLAAKEVTMSKLCRVRRKLMERKFGSHELNFQRLPCLLEHLNDKGGCYTNIGYKPKFRNKVQFKEVEWCFVGMPYAQRVRDNALPMIFMDACHGLRADPGGMWYCFVQALSIGGYVPLAIGWHKDSEETVDTWEIMVKEFMECMGGEHTYSFDDLTVVSDRSKGLKGGVRGMQGARHLHCALHIATNAQRWAKVYHTRIKTHLAVIGRAYTEQKLNERMNDLKSEFPNVAAYLEGKPRYDDTDSVRGTPVKHLKNFVQARNCLPGTFTPPHFRYQELEAENARGDRRHILPEWLKCGFALPQFDIITSNYVESFNASIRLGRRLPICAAVREMVDRMRRQYERHQRKLERAKKSPTLHGMLPVGYLYAEMHKSVDESRDWSVSRLKGELRGNLTGDTTNPSYAYKVQSRAGGGTEVVVRVFDYGTNHPYARCECSQLECIGVPCVHIVAVDTNKKNMLGLPGNGDTGYVRATDYLLHPALRSEAAERSLSLASYEGGLPPSHQLIVDSSIAYAPDRIGSLTDNTRIHGALDKAPKRKLREMHCGRCGEPGHNCKTCKATEQAVAAFEDRKKRDKKKRRRRWNK